MKMLTTFPRPEESGRARDSLNRIGLSYETVSPDPGYARVGVPALAMDAEARVALAKEAGDIVCSGWVDYRPAEIIVTEDVPPDFEEDVFGRASVMVLAPCVADETKIRLIAHISGDLTEVFPYVNAEIETASYNQNGPTFTFMEKYRMISLRPRRITVAKADEIVDAWRVLEMIRRRVNEVWAKRAQIEPCYQMRERPPVLEIFKRLPRTNCGQCGERTCLAFAARVRAGERSIRECAPVFEGEYRDLREALTEIVQAVGVE